MNPTTFSFGCHCNFRWKVFIFRRQFPCQAIADHHCQPDNVCRMMMYYRKYKQLACHTFMSLVVNFHKMLWQKNRGHFQIPIITKPIVSSHNEYLDGIKHLLTHISKYRTLQYQNVHHAIFIIHESKHRKRQYPAHIHPDPLAFESVECSEHPNNGSGPNDFPGVS